MSAEWNQVFVNLGPAPKHTVPDGTIIYAIGDVHGCLDPLNRLLDAIAKDLAGRRLRSHLVFLGDLVDRGPRSADVIDRLRKGSLPTDEVHFIMGNHEEVLVDCHSGMVDQYVPWVKYGGLETLESYGLTRADILAATSDFGAVIRAVIPPGHVRFIKSFKDHVQLGGYVFVHAGIRPGIPLSAQSQHDLRWIRQGFLDSRKNHGSMIVHGHTIVPQVQFLRNRIAVDTGCYLGGKLSAVVLEANRLRVIAVEGGGEH